MNARDKVADAESAEQEADEALHAARVAVREARDHVKSLEREALEEYVFSRQQTCTNLQGLTGRGRQR
jgi:CHAD domain-containing protein